MTRSGFRVSLGFSVQVGFRVREKFRDEGKKTCVALQRLKRVVKAVTTRSTSVLSTKSLYVTQCPVLF
jgi:hypothetical protein